MTRPLARDHHSGAAPIPSANPCSVVARLPGRGRLPPLSRLVSRLVPHYRASSVTARTRNTDTADTAAAFFTPNRPLSVSLTATEHYTQSAHGAHVFRTLLRPVCRHSCHRTAWRPRPCPPATRTLLYYIRSCARRWRPQSLSLSLSLSLSSRSARFVCVLVCADFVYLRSCARRWRPRCPSR